MKYGLRPQYIVDMQAVFTQYAKIDRVILYGSRAKGTQHQGSDIDLTLIGASLALEDLYAIDDALDAINLPYFIDLSLYAQIDNRSFLDHIQRCGKDFYTQ